MIHLFTEGYREVNTTNTQKNSADKELHIVKASEICMQVSQGGTTSYYENINGEEQNGDFLRPDFKNNKDYLAVMANTMSAEDFEEMMKEGHRPEDYDGTESVNTLDQIKAKLAESGVVIKGYNDDLSVDEMEEILGSRVAAEALCREFRERDLSLDKESVKEIAKVFDKAQEITEITDGMCDYILRNAIEPTIDNLYRVRFCAAEIPFKEAGYFTDEMGYKAKDAESNTLESDEFVRKIEEFGKRLSIDDTKELLTEADWLVKSKILCNESNLKTLDNLRKLTMPASNEECAAAIANSFERGFDVSKADFSQTENLSFTAKEAVSVIQKADSSDIKKIVAGEMELTIENLRNVKDKENRNEIADDNPEYIRKEKILLEARVRMTYESGYRLLKQGISIEKTALEETVNVLKALEDRVNREFFGGSDYEEKTNLYNNSRKVIAEMPFIPLKAVGDAIKTNQTFTLRLTYETGVIIKEQFEKAGKEYESLQTEVRSDLGDNIKKTFEDAYKILKEEGLEENETNKKAVRILGYSEIELTKENIEEAAKKESSLERVITKMNPGAVLRLIRENVNPLDTSMEELERILDGYDDEAMNSADNYARFICKLERRNEISEEEKESFIGIYRLLDKIEKSDGSAIGSLMKADTAINFKNLLTAVRSGKSRGMSFKADLSFGEALGEAGYKFDINDQIMTAFDKFVKDEDNSAFYNEEYKSYKEMIQKDNSFANEELTALGEKTSPASLSAMTELLFYKKEYNPWKKFDELTEKLERNGYREAVLDLSESFEDKETVQKAFENVLKEAEDAVKRLPETGIDGYLDIKSIKTAFRQIGLVTRMTDEENYEVPVMFEEGLVNIRLKITHKSEKEGKVFASFEDEKFGKILAQFSVRDNAVSGLIAGENEIGLEKLKSNELFEQNFEKAGFEEVTFNYLQTDIINEDYFRQHFKEQNSDEVTTKELYKIAKTFIETVKKAGI